MPFKSLKQTKKDGRVNSLGKAYCVIDETDLMGQAVAEDFKNRKIEYLNAAIRWISAHRKNYISFGVKAVALEKKVQEICTRMDKERPGPASREKEAVLAAFFEGFVNNPYAYEQRLEKTHLNCITANRNDCYFVTIGGCPLPLGCLRSFSGQGGKWLSYLAEKHMDKSREELNILLNGITEGETASAETEPRTEKIPVSRLVLHLAGGLALVGVLLFLLGEVWKVIAAVNWEKRAFFAQRTEHWYQAFYFMAEEGLGISHNSTLGLVWFIVAVLIGIGALFTVKPLLKSLGWGLGQLLSARKGGAIVQKPVLERLTGNMILEQEIQRVKKPFRQAKSGGLAFLKKLQKPRRGFGWTIVLLTLLLLVASYGVSDEVLRDKYDRFVGSILNTVELAKESRDGIYVEKVGTVARNTPLLALPAQEAMTLEMIPAGCDYYPQEELTPTEGYVKVRIRAEKGSLTGWCSEQHLGRFNPQTSGGYQECTPAKFDSTSAGWNWGFGPEKVGDKNTASAWRENADGLGVGESVTVSFAEELAAKRVQVIGIVPGNGKSNDAYLQNGRPLSLEAEFTVGNEQRHLTLVLEDRNGWQYFKFNKPVDAKQVKLTIEEAVGGTRNETVYISEIALYQSKSEEGNVL